MQRMARLDGLRGVLAVYVMLGHAMPFTALPAWLTAPLHHGEAAVDLFFCLSGLVVVNSLERFGYRAGPFFVARAWRLLPVYWCVLVLAVGLAWAGSPLPAMAWVKPGSLAAQFWALGLPGDFWAHFGAHLLLVHGVIPQGMLPWAWISLLGPAWSLSTEWQFYGVMAAALRPGRWRALALGLAALAVAYRAGAGFLPGYWAFSRAFLPDAAGYFGLGLASAVWLREGDWLVFAAVLAVVVGLGVGSTEASKGLIGLGWLLVMLAQRFDVVPVLPGLLESRAARFLGAVSYPLYLVNEPVQRAAAMLVAPWARGDVGWFTAAWLPLAVAGPVLAAWGLHVWVERPLMRGWRLGWGRKKALLF